MKENRRQNIYRIIMLIIVVSVITFVVTNILNYDNTRKYVISNSKDTNIIQKIETSAGSLKKILDEKYIGELKEEDLLEGALKGMIAGVGDVYTEYYSKKELEDFTASTLGNFVGIGIYMQADTESGRVIVISPIADSPAEKAGIKPGDKIIKVDDVEYKAEDINKISEYIRGEVGTEVKITISRNDEIIDFTIKRENIHINYVSSQILEDDIGYIAILTFDDGCCKDFIKCYDELAAKRNKKTNC